MKVLFLSFSVAAFFAWVPAQADEGFVFPGGFIVGTTAGIAAASAGPNAGPPPPPAPYRTGYTGYAGRGPHGTRCWIEPRQQWDGFGFAVQHVRICD